MCRGGEQGCPLLPVWRRFMALIHEEIYEYAGYHRKTYAIASGKRILLQQPPPPQPTSPTVVIRSTYGYWTTGSSSSGTGYCSRFEGAQHTQPIRSKITTGIGRVVCCWYPAKNGISAAWALKSCSRSSPSAIFALTGNVSLPISIIASGLATRL